MSKIAAYFFPGLVVLIIFQAVVIAQPAMGQCVEPTQEHIIPVTSAIETIIVDNSHHHLGNDVKEDLIPKEPEAVVYEKTFLLDSEFDAPELNLIAKSVRPYEINATEYMGRVYINDVEVGLLNCYFKPIPASLFSMDTKSEDDLNKGIISEDLKSVFKTNGFPLSDYAFIISWGKENIWTISDPSNSQKLFVIKEGGKLDVYQYSPEAPGPAEVDISFDRGLLKIGNNTIKITSGSNKDGSNHDDFEFYQLEFKGVRKTGWVLSGRVLFDDEPARFAGVSIYRHGTDELVSHSDTDAQGLYSSKLSNGKYDVKVESHSDMRYISPNSETITIDNSNISLDFKTPMLIAVLPTVLGLVIFPFLMPSIMAGFIIALSVYVFTKKRKTAVFGFVLGIVGIYIINLLMILAMQSGMGLAQLSGELFQSRFLGIPLIITLPLLLSAGITFILVAVPIILLNRRKVS
ncbi:MAG: hypothetical protein OIN66_00140 [Candidatus Methanoperedens sp.]|nr:hypothetical protein [Candidatus Methanoperedens sp.]